MPRASVVITSLLVAVSSIADAAVLCARRRADGTYNSAVRIREACLAREVELDPDLLGLRGPKGETGSPGERGEMGPPGVAAAVTVRDSVGTIVGAWKPEPANAGQAILTLSSNAVAIPVLPYGFYDSQAVRTYHESADCSGPPLLRDALIADGGAPHPNFLFVFQGTDASGTAYYPRALRFSSLLGSYDLAGCAVCAPYNCSCAPLTTSSGCAAAGGSFMPPDHCCFSYAGGASEVVGEVGTFDLSTLGFVPPFHLEGP